MIIYYIIIGLLGIGNLIFIYTTFNLLRKNEVVEDYVAGYIEYLDRISLIIELADIKLKQVDNKGIFKSDDEIGFVFEEIKQLQKVLNEFNLKTINLDGQNNPKNSNQETR